jgi:hypothetical protein
MWGRMTNRLKRGANKTAMEVSKPLLLAFFTALLLALALIAWFGGCKAQAQMNSDDEKLQAIIQSHAADDGLWLCDTPATTHNLDTDIAMTVQTRITLTTSILEQISYKWACKRVDADNLKPIGYLSGWDAVRVAGGPHGKGMQTIVGWAPMSFYLAYMQRHVVRKPDAK